MVEEVKWKKCFGKRITDSRNRRTTSERRETNEVQEQLQNNPKN